MTLPAVSSLSAEFGRIERLLQVQLNAPQLQVSQCFDLTSPQVDATFNQFARTIQPPNVVTTFVLASTVNQTATDIAAKGLRVDPNTGFKFTLDHFPIDRSAESLDVLVVQVALGSTLNWQSPALTKEPDVPYLSATPTHADLRPGYHSLSVSGTKQYVIFSAAQVNAGYLVKFAGGANVAEHKEVDMLCDVCHERESTVFCLNDSAKLCAQCDKTSHEVNPVLARHERLPLPDARALMEFCPLHPKSRVEYYCPICKMPVCINCKMTGTHSKGPEATHVLTPIKDAYNQALDATEPEDPILAYRKSEIGKKKGTAGTLLQDVFANEESVEEEIKKIAEEAIEQARRLAGEKALIIRSVQTELQRKQGEVEGLERSLLAHRKKSGPQAFLRAVDRHVAIVNGLSNTEDLPPELTVHSDLTVYGNLTVGGLRDAELSQGSRGLAALLASGDGAIDDSAFNETPNSPIRRRGESGLAITSLALVSRKKERRSKGVVLAFQPFQRSKILTDPQEALVLYRCFPFKAAPQPHLLFSTVRDGRSIGKMHTLIDGIGITAVIIQVGDQKFGGFAASKWNSDGVPFGEEGCSFLFNVTKDAIVPYKQDAKDAFQLFGTPDLISFGRKDLVLAGDFQNSSSVIENSYGVGFAEGSTEAKTFLAGSEKFVPDQVEVWGFYTID